MTIRNILKMGDPRLRKGVFGVRAQIRRAYGSPGGRGALHRSEIGV